MLLKGKEEEEGGREGRKDTKENGENARKDNWWKRVSTPIWQL